MSTTMLQALAGAKLPLTIEGEDLADAVWILKLAGHVEAALAPPVRMHTGWRHPKAVVHAITSSGRRMLSLFPPRPR